MSTKKSNLAGQYLSSNSIENVTSILLDVYLLPTNPNVSSVTTFCTEPETLIELANLAVQLNTYIQQYSIKKNTGHDHQNHDKNVKKIPESPCYRWISGGDGPVFGIHVSPGASRDPCDQEHDSQTTKPGTFVIPHLRAIGRYGVCVNDEWCLIGLVLDFLENFAGNSIMPYGIAVECWDMDDGQILLIEGAPFIPQWIDAIEPDQCSHRCWICTSNIHTTLSVSKKRGWDLLLLRPLHVLQTEPLHLGDAVQLLANHQFENTTSVVEIAPTQMEEAILKRIRLGQTELQQCHRAAVVLPASVVQLFHRRPDLIATACQMFVENIQEPIRVQKVDDYLFGACENWIWATLPFGRTAYAMIRTATSPPEWIYEDSIAPSILASSSLEVKRYQRQCAVEATPHLRYGVQLGVRILAGLHHCVQAHVATSTKNATVMSTTERRVLHYWSQVAKQCGMDDRSNPPANDWITSAWYAGPNETKHDIKPLLQCPVFVPEIQSSITPLSCPDTDLGEQIRTELLRRHNSEQLTSNPPHHTQVDNEDWMWILSSSKDALLATDAQTPFSPKSSTLTASKITSGSAEESTLDEMLTGVQSFMDGTSTVNGVETSAAPTEDSHLPIVINPTVFLNILHMALKSDSAKELSDQLNEMQNAATNSYNDPFFSDEDYRLMDPPSDDESNDDVDDIDNDAMDMKDIMNVMDAELRESASTSRAWDNVDGVTSDDDIARNAHVLSNLLKSIDAGGGGPGPMRNMLMEMGGAVPSTRDVDDDESNEENDE